MARIIIITDLPGASTGYATAGRGLGKYLQRMGHDIAYIGLQHIGDPTGYPKDPAKEGWKEQVLVYEGIQTLSMERAFREWEPQLAVHIRDAFAHNPKFHSGAYSFKGMKARPATILWSPVQGDWLPDEFVAACMTEAELCMVFTDWGKDVLMFQGVPFNRLETVRLGYDPEVLHSVPQAEVEELKEAWDWKGKQIVGSVGISDQHRKGWPILVKALGIVDKKRDIGIYFHTSPEGHYLINHHAEKNGLKGKIRMPQPYNKTWGLPSEKMNLLLDSFTVYANSSIAEGANLPNLEALALGKPVVTTDLPVHREMLGEFARYPLTTQTYPDTWTFGWLADVDDLAAKIIEALDEEKKVGPEHSMTPQLKEHLAGFTWEALAKRFVEMVNKHSKNLNGVTL